MNNFTQLEREFYFRLDPTNLITNSGFESGTTGWSLESDYTRSDEASHSGDYSIKQDSADGFESLLTEDAGISVIPGKGYTLSYWADVTVNSGNEAKIRVTAVDKYGDNPSGVTLIENDVEASDGFTERALSFVGPSTGIVWVRVFNNGGSVTAYYDDFKITPNRFSYELTDAKRLVWANATGLNINQGQEDLERAWLRKLITDGGGTPTGSYLSDLYKQAASVVGGKSTNYERDNKLIIYGNA